MQESVLDQALDAALQRSLIAPPLPPGFRSHLMAGVARQGQRDIPSSRMALAVERERQLGELRQGYLRLQRRTLFTMIAVAFGAGLLAATVLPPMRAQFGELGLLAVPLVAAVVGVVVGAASWWRGSAVARLLE
jgi:peptidoglycan/LPS O-acetylase OafA/YrhL